MRAGRAWTVDWRVVSCSIAAVVAGLVGTGCSSEEGESAVGETMFGLPVSEYQREVLADGAVTEAEFEAAAVAHRECVLARGVDVGPLERHPDGVYWTFSFALQPGEDPATGPGITAFHECEDEYISILTMWKYNEAIPVGAERDAAWRELLACLEEFGVSGVSVTDREAQVVARVDEVLGDDTQAVWDAGLCIDRSFLFWEPFAEDG